MASLSLYSVFMCSMLSLQLCAGSCSMASLSLYSVFMCSMLSLQLCAGSRCSSSSPDQKEAEDEGRPHCRDGRGEVSSQLMHSFHVCVDR